MKDGEAIQMQAGLWYPQFTQSLHLFDDGVFMDFWH